MSRIGQRNRHGGHIDVNVSLTDHSHNRQGNGTHSIRSGVRQRGRGSGQLKDLGIFNHNGLGADHFTAGDDLHVYVTLLAIGDKLAVNDATEGSVGQCPGSVSGHVHGIAVGIDGLCGEGVGRLGSEEIVVGLDVDHVKDTCGGHVGGHENTVSGGSLCAIAGHRTHGKGLLTDTLGQEGRGSTTVAVGSPLTAQSKHSLALFIVAETNRVVGTTTVIHTNDQSTVLFDTDHRTGGCSRSTLFGLGDKLAVLNDHTEGYADCVEQRAVGQVAVKLSTVEGFHIARNVAIGILEHIQDGTGWAGLALHAEILTVVDQDAGSVGVVVQVGVHTADDVVSEGILVILGHLSQLLMRPVGLVGQILVDLVVAGNDRNIGIGRINLDDVHDLSASTACIIDNDLTLDSCTGYQRPFLTGDDRIIIVGSKAITCFNACSYICIFSKSNHRDHTDDHQKAEQSGQNLGQCFSFHNKLLF